MAVVARGAAASRCAALGSPGVGLVLGGEDRPPPWVGLPLGWATIWVEAVARRLVGFRRPAGALAVAEWRTLGLDVVSLYEIRPGCSPPVPGAARHDFGDVSVYVTERVTPRPRSRPVGLSVFRGRG